MAQITKTNHFAKPGAKVGLLVHQVRRLCLGRMLSDVHEIEINKRILLRNPEAQTGNKDNRTVVFLLGWGDCRLKDLKKYSALFEERGCRTVLVKTTFLHTIMFPESRVKPLADQVLTQVRPYLSKTEMNPAILFPFSNGGCSLYLYLAYMLLDKSGPHYNLLDMKGNIFDSAPIYPAMKNMGRIVDAFTQFTRSAIARKVMEVGLRTFIPLVIFFNSDAKAFMDGLQQLEWTCPQLFLFSKTDKLAPYEDIKQVADYRQQLTGNVLQKCWDDSPHVSHYRYHPTEYVEMIDKFLHLCEK